MKQRPTHIDRIPLDAIERIQGQGWRQERTHPSLGLGYALCLLGGGAAVIVLGWHAVRWLFRG